VTDAAWNGRAAAARGGKLLAARDAAIRHIGDEARAGIAIEDDFLVLRHLDDAVAQRLAAAVGMDQALVARADVGSRDSVSLDDANPRRRLDRGKIVGRLLDLGIRDDLCHGYHGRTELAVARLPIQSRSIAPG
jgi:hypothetical protein